MMSKDYSLDGLYRFLDYAIEKGLMKAETAKGRKRAAKAILSIFEPSEVADLRDIDVDDVSHRFAIKQGTDFKPASLKVYQSRLRSALIDFFAYVENPIEFRSSINTRDKTGSTKSQKNTVKSIRKTDSPSALPTEERYVEHEKHASLVFPIPIRPGLVVKVSNIPDNLTHAEAEKISAVIKALAMVNPE